MVESSLHSYSGKELDHRIIEALNGGWGRSAILVYYRTGCHPQIPFCEGGLDIISM